MLKQCKKAIWAGVVGCGLVACGGGGDSQDLEVYFTYSDGSTAYLWEPATQDASINGLNGNRPKCEVVEGRLPQGMNINSSTCNISGTPTEQGSFPVTVRLTVDDYKGNVETSTAIAVRGPSASYPSAFGAGGLTWGYEHNEKPTVDYYHRHSADELVYRVMGKLPKGLTLDSTTGRLQGVVAETGTFEPDIELTVIRNGMTSKNIARSPIVVKELRGFLYSPDPLTTYLDVKRRPTWQDREDPNDTFKYALVEYDGCPDVLPTGLSFDNNTGVIFGTAEAGLNTCVGVRGTITRNGLSKTYYAVAELKS